MIHLKMVLKRICLGMMMRVMEQKRAEKIENNILTNKGVSPKLSVNQRLKIQILTLGLLRNERIRFYNSLKAK